MSLKIHNGSTLQKIRMQYELRGVSGPGMVDMLISGQGPTYLDSHLCLTEADRAVNSFAISKENVCLRLLRIKRLHSLNANSLDNPTETKSKFLDPYVK